MVPSDREVCMRPHVVTENKSRRNDNGTGLCTRPAGSFIIFVDKFRFDGNYCEV